MLWIFFSATIPLIVAFPAAYTERYHPEQYNGCHYSDLYHWGKDTIRKILDRKDYLGHTVLKKTKSTIFPANMLIGSCILNTFEIQFIIEIIWIADVISRMAIHL